MALLAEEQCKEPTEEANHAGREQPHEEAPLDEVTQHVSHEAPHKGRSEEQQKTAILRELLAVLNCGWRLAQQRFNYLLRSAPQYFRLFRRGIRVANQCGWFARKGESR